MGMLMSRQTYDMREVRPRAMSFVTLISERKISKSYDITVKMFYNVNNMLGVAIDDDHLTSKQWEGV